LAIIKSETNNTLTPKEEFDDVLSGFGGNLDPGFCRKRHRGWQE